MVISFETVLKFNDVEWQSAALAVFPNNLNLGSSVKNGRLDTK